MHAVRMMEADVSVHLPAFRSPIDQGKQLEEWGKMANKLAQSCTGLNKTRCSELEHHYEALRLLVTSWEEGFDIAALFLQCMDAHCTDGWSPSTLTALELFRAAVPAQFLRFERLCDVLEYELGNRPDFRGIIFVEKRVTTHVIEYFVKNHPALQARLAPACVYATTSPATASLSVSPSEFRSRIAKFATGEVNLLIATVVAEEGVDVQEANCVIRFDPMVHSVSFVQGRGRARAAGSSFIVLAERADRPVSLLADVERQQAQRVREIAASGSTLNEAEQQARQREAQLSRERTAAPTLSALPGGALQALNLWCKKTKVDLVKSWSTAEGGSHTVTLLYESCLRTESATCAGQTKKAAEAAAAEALVLQLRRQVGEFPTGQPGQTSGPVRSSR